MKADLDTIVNLANDLQADAVGEAKVTATDLAAEAESFRTAGLVAIDENAGFSAAEINLQIIELYQQVETLENLQRELRTQTLAQLQETIDTQQTIISRIITQFSVLGSAAVLLAIFAVVFVTRVLAPVRTLTEAAQDISEGKLRSCCSSAE